MPKKTDIGDYKNLPAGWRARDRELTWIERSEEKKNERKQEEEGKTGQTFQPTGRKITKTQPQKMLGIP